MGEVKDLKLITDMFPNNNVFTRKILFEKYSNVINKTLLTDFNSGYWMGKNVDINSVFDTINGNDLSFMYGESFNHEEEQESFEVRLNNTSHQIKNIFIEDEKIYGDVIFFKTPRGKECRMLFKDDMMKISMRALGWVDNNEINGNIQNTTIIQQIIAWDLILK